MEKFKQFLANVVELIYDTIIKVLEFGMRHEFGTSVVSSIIGSLGTILVMSKLGKL